MPKISKLLANIKIRMLVDQGQLEVFANGGIYSYSEEFAFTPDRDDIGFFTNGSLRLTSMSFHEIGSIWY